MTDSAIDNRPSILKCPVCDLALLRDERRYECANQHSFDIAREGYANLLLANQKKSKDPGDNTDMIQHRRQFLRQGYYDPLARYIVSTLTPLLAGIASPVKTLLDIGCGEGYYTNYLQQNLPSPTIGCGIDISKTAIQLAAKSYTALTFVVGSVSRLPVLDNSVTGAVKVFAPSSAAELARVIAPGGYLLTVTPAANHLIQLRELIYEQVRPYEADTDDDIRRYFTPVSQHELAYSVQMDAAPDIEHLFKMTPFYWSTPTEKQNQILRIDRIQMDVAFKIDVFQRSQ